MTAYGKNLISNDFIGNSKEIFLDELDNGENLKEVEIFNKNDVSEGKIVVNIHISNRPKGRISRVEKKSDLANRKSLNT